MRDADSYLRELYQRLPRGPIWPTQAAEAPTWDALLDALAEEFGRIDADASNALADFFPDVTEDALEDWERLLGLPDCGLSLGTLAERRGAVLAKLRRKGNPTLANVQAIADGFENGAVVTTGGTADLFFIDNVTEFDNINDFATTSAAFQVHITYDAPQSDTFECSMRHAIPLHLTITFEVV